MGSCDYCGTTVIMGGVKDGDLRFCSEKCHERGYLLTMAQSLPADQVFENVRKVHQGPCPKCGGPGPVDVHTSYMIWSLVVLTSFNSKPEICCRSCGLKSQVTRLFLSTFLGWWGIPFGIIMTPVQIARNLAGLVSGPDPSTPSPRLEKIIRANLAEQAAMDPARRPLP